MSAHSIDIRVLDQIQRSHRNQKADHFVVLKIDGKKVFESNKALFQPAPQWKQQKIIHFKPSSVIEIALYRQSSLRVWWHTVAEYSARGMNFMDTEGAEQQIIDKSEKLHLGVKFDVAIESMKSNAHFMNAVDSDLSRLAKSKGAGTARMAETIGSQLGPILKLIVPIIDTFAATHPILNAAWIVLSSTYKIAQYQIAQDYAVRVLVEALREMVGAANAVPDLRKIEGTTDVIEDIGRTSFEAAKLVHDYVLPSYRGKASFVGSYFLSVTIQLPKLSLPVPLARIAHNLPSSMSLRVTQCEQKCIELTKKLDRRVLIDIKTIVGDINAEVLDVGVKLKDFQQNDKKRKIHEWIKAPDISPSYNAARKKHQPGTGSWFLNGPQFLEWKEKPGSNLWLYGGPGCGKTILCSSAIQNIIEFCKLKPEARSYAYVFFDGTMAQSEALDYNKFIRSLITQISNRHSDPIHAALADIYHACDDGQLQPLESQLENTVSLMLQSFESTYIIIDSPDECLEKADLLKWIQSVTLEASGRLHLMITSRPELEIEQGLASLPHLQRVSIGDQHAMDDIDAYLDARLQGTEMNKWREPEKQTIKKTLSDGSGGMFRWVVLQMDDVMRCLNKAQLTLQLMTLPRGLDATYAKILQQSHYPEALKTLLQFLVYSKIPMTLNQLADVLAVDFHASDGPTYKTDQRLERASDILGICYGLVVEFEGTVKLAHFSVKEYFVKRITSEELSQSVITQVCLANVLHLDQPGVLNWADPPSNIRGHIDLFLPLARYAASNWVSHLRLSGAGATDFPPLRQMLSKLFEMPSTTRSYALNNWVHLHHLGANNISGQLPLGASPLYYACFIGAIHTVQHLIQNGADIDAAEGDTSNRPLLVASSEGHLEVVKLLLDNSADPNTRDERIGTALQVASSKGHLAVAKLLLEMGADANIRAGEYGTALHAASSEGHLEVARLLLGKAAEVNIQGGPYGTALQTASAKDNREVAKFLLENGANANAEAGTSGTALYIASSQGYLELCKLLLDNGADTNIQGENHETALHVASLEGHLEVANLLLQKGADVNIEGDIYGTALQAACARGHLEVAKLLLDNKANPNIKGWTSETALYMASSQANLELATLLLENGAGVNVQGGSHGTAIHAASVAGHLEIVQMLLVKGADANIEGGFYGTALQAASAGGHFELVKLLLKNGAGVNVEEGFYGTELQAASSGGHLEVLELLLERGADPNIQGGDYGTALHAASAEGHLDVARMLLSNGADANIQVGDYGTALQAASMGGHVQVARLLLDEGAVVNCKGGFHGSALRAARAGGYLEMEQLLRERGVAELL
ncbi:hypothetical protein HWV62_19483 [Athelia sp. TMB]|nr:hypothetical protein HWV62_19483 [Athelia sp. TMB]